MERDAKQLDKIAKAMSERHPRCLEYSPEFFQKAVKAQEGVELSREEVLKVAKTILQKYSHNLVVVKGN